MGDNKKYLMGRVNLRVEIFLISRIVCTRAKLMLGTVLHTGLQGKFKQLIG